MTIGKQLSLILTLMVGTAVSIAFVQGVLNQKRFVSEQTQIQAEDAAAALAVSLSQLMGDQRKTEVATVVNTFFDSGYYSKIVVQDAANKVIYERTLEAPLPFELPPAWFRSLFLWKLTPVKQPIMKGWQKTGAVLVEPFDGVAVAHLWQLAVRSFWSLAAIVMIAVVVSRYVARYWLRPIQNITELAKSIQRGEFKTISPPPKTEELAILTNAINRMSLALAEQIRSLDLRVKQWHEACVTDSVTQLPNRLAFLHELEAILGDDELKTHLALGLVRLDLMEKVNSEFGYQLGNDWLVMVAAMLRKAFAHVEGAKVFRMDGPEFAVLLSKTEPVEIEAIWLRVISECRRASVQFDAESSVFGGLAWLPNEVDSRKALTLANAALQQARATENGVFIYDNVDSLLPKDTRTRLLARALDDLPVQWWRQPIRCVSGAIEYELFSRWPLDNKTYVSTADLASGIVDVDKIRALDARLIEAAIQLHPNAPHALNINLALYESKDALTQLMNHFTEPEKWRLETSRLWLPESAKRIARVVDALQRNGMRVGIDHFSVDSRAAEWLSIVKPSYIKINVKLAQLRAGDNQESLLQWLKPLCQTLSIDLILTGIETRELLLWAEQQGVTGYQGYFIGRPEPIGNTQNE
ncbi:MAG: EAL domain-containing protein [Gammaproteobacteria bacterium]|nr:MAG: EAL domain-containing protein [Gammaproteobacteria bacterium]